MKNFLFVCGGTAGHINPALAFAAEIKKNQKDAKILFVGTPDGMEARLVPAVGFDFVGIPVMGFYRTLSVGSVKHNIRAVKCLTTAGSKAKKIIRKFKPDLCFGTGGYVSGPVIRAAHSLKIKTAIHEQNAFPGVTNKILSKYVDIVFAANEGAAKQLASKVKPVVVGNPVRESIIFADKAAAIEKLGLDGSVPTILSFGGSLGADIINRAGADIIAHFIKSGEKVNILHGYGRLGKEKFPRFLKENGVDIKNLPSNIRVSEYIDNMDDALAAADVCISRAGALTLSELAVSGTPAFLIPSPYVTANHQYHNALEYKKAGAAEVLEEKDYNFESIQKFLQNVLFDSEIAEKYRKGMTKMGIVNTSALVWEEIKAL
jgi:UDP-N-acetylglucosamine:LPS N-acetylglucosamine transferase